MTLRPMKPITKPGEGKKRQKYVSLEVYLKERYKISVGLEGPKRLENESFEDYKVRRKAENGLLKEYLRGVWVKDDEQVYSNTNMVDFMFTEISQKLMKKPTYAWLEAGEEYNYEKLHEFIMAIHSHIHTLRTNEDYSKDN